LGAGVVGEWEEEAEEKREEVEEGGVEC